MVLNVIFRYQYILHLAVNPLAIEPNIIALWDMDLSPGTLTLYQLKLCLTPSIFKTNPLSKSYNYITSLHMIKIHSTLSCTTGSTNTILSPIFFLIIFYNMDQISISFAKK